MRQAIFALPLCAALGVLASAQQPQTPPPAPPQSQQPPSVRINMEGGGTPKLAIAGVIPLSPDAETVAAAKTIADVLYDDINYEREFYKIGRASCRERV